MTGLPGGPGAPHRPIATIGRDDSAGESAVAPDESTNATPATWFATGGGLTAVSPLEMAAKWMCRNDPRNDKIPSEPKLKGDLVI